MSTSRDNADNHHQRRSAKTVVSLTKFAHAKSKGTRRAIEQYKQKRKSKFNRNASLLREYRKVMKKEGYEAGKGASRKRSLDDEGREIEESENGDDHEEVQHENENSDSEDNDSDEQNQQLKQQKMRRHKTDPLAKAKQMAKQSKEDEIKRREMKVKEQEEHKRKLKQKQQRSRKLAKRTNRGQPVMKHVVDDLLEKIKKSVNK